MSNKYGETLAEGDKPAFILDGGPAAWLQVFGSFFMFFNSWYVSIMLGDVLVD